MKKLSPEVSKYYKLITIRPGTYSFPDFGSIDLTVITLAEARDLVKNGFEFLQPLNSLKEKLPSDRNKKVLTIRTTKLGLPFKESGEYQENQNNPPENLNKNSKIIRGNKRYINKLLTLNYSDLDFKEKGIFFYSEKYFYSKKYLLHHISKLTQQMKAYHEKLKLVQTDEERKEINNKLWIADDLKSQAFIEMDTWEHQIPDLEDPIEKAARQAVEKEKEIKTLTNYIGRFDDRYLALPEESEKQRAKKHQKIQEVEKRKQRLIALGFPYNRKKRK